MALPPEGRQSWRERRAERRQVRHARKRLRSPWVLVALTALAAVLFAGTWVGVLAWNAKGELQQAQALVSTLKTQISEGHYSGVVEQYDEIRKHTQKARDLTDDPLWSAAEHVPMLGRNLSAMRGITSIIDDAMAASTSLVDLASSLSPESLAPHGGAIPLDPFVAAATDVPIAATSFAALSERLKALPTQGTLHQLQSAQTELSGILDSAATGLEKFSPTVRALPAILGADAPRTYVVMFLNNAELRSLGGTALSFAEISVDHGVIKLVRVVPASGGNFPKHPTPLVPIPDGFSQIDNGALGYFIAESTGRPSPETAAQYVQAEWQSTFGQKIDGVVSIDAAALGLLLKALPPLTLSTGDVVTSDNVVKLLLNDVYIRYDSGDNYADNLKQGEVYSETLDKTFTAFSTGDFDAAVLFSSVRAATAANRLSVWFTADGEREAVAQTGLAAGGLPQSTATEDVVGVYLNDEVGAKLNYYLGTTLTTGSAMCTADGRQVHRVTLTMTNNVPPASVAGLSPSISGSAYKNLDLPKGAQRLLVFAYLPPGATLLSASADGAPVASTQQHDTDHPVQSMWVTVPAGETHEVSFDIEMGTPGKRALVVDYTPTVSGTKVVAAPLDCAGVKLP